MAMVGRGLALGACFGLACSIDSRSTGVAEPGATGAGGSRGAVVGAASDAVPASVPGAGGSASFPGEAAPVVDAACSEQPLELRPSPTDLLVQLDTSASMLDAIPGAGATGSTKWDAVRTSLQEFAASAASGSIGIGLSYFPQTVDGVPDICTDNAECAGAGPCTSSICAQNGSLALPDADPATFVSVAGDAPSFCAVDADCGVPGSSCRTLVGECIYPPGVVGDAGAFLNVSPDPATSVLSPLCENAEDCSGVPLTVCEQVGVCSEQLFKCSPSIPCPAGAGTCTPFPYTCIGKTQCEASVYVTPAVPISDAAARADTFERSLTAQLPSGQTPTGPALQGALEYARGWAAEHPERQLATLLVTDGFPTECDPVEIPAIAELAAAATRAEPPVRTFVLGVFGTADLGADGSARLDEIARAGGTERAFLASEGDISGSLRSVLESIRSLASGCGVELDAAAARVFERASLELEASDGAVRSLTRVTGAASCADADGGWYTVIDGAGMPARIELCPEVCAGRDASARVRLRPTCP